MTTGDRLQKQWQAIDRWVLRERAKRVAAKLLQEQKAKAKAKEAK